MSVQGLSLALTVAAMLAGCASVTAPSEQESWGYSAASAQDPARLIYGLPDSDVVSLGFSCAPGSGKAQVLLFAGDGEWSTERLSMGSGGHRQAFALKDSGATETYILTAPVDPSGPLATAFRKTGRAWSEVEGHRRDVSASRRAERAQVAAFWSVCGRQAPP